MAADGYRQAGFEPFGMDIRPQPNYPYEFRQGNALEILEDFLQGKSLFISLSFRWSFEQ